MSGRRGSTEQRFGRSRKSQLLGSRGLRKLSDPGASKCNRHKSSEMKVSVPAQMVLPPIERSPIGGWGAVLNPALGIFRKTGRGAVGAG
jgi:hypothetical protein